LDPSPFSGEAGGDPDPSPERAFDEADPSMTIDRSSRIVDLTKGLMPLLDHFRIRSCWTEELLPIPFFFPLEASSLLVDKRFMRFCGI
jgi:hypothetical protein